MMKLAKRRAMSVKAALEQLPEDEPIVTFSDGTTVTASMLRDCGGGLRLDNGYLITFEPEGHFNFEPPSPTEAPKVEIREADRP